MQHTKKVTTFSSLSYKRLLFGGLFALLTTFALQAQTTRYVKATAAGTGNGSSWANASADLQAMINASAVNDQVWVAAGTYKPTKDPFGSASPADPRDKTFHVKDGVKIYGGFSASAPESTLAARNINTNVTTLSGDFNSNDVVSGSGAWLSIKGNTENAYHVVIASAASGGGGGVTIDGFTIKGGNANGNNNNIHVNGNSLWPNFGGGIYTNFGTNTISNNTFSGNSATTLGAGIYIVEATNTISNNTLSGNFGIGIFTLGGTNTISNNTLSGNFDGGIFTGKGTNTISNNTLSGNFGSGIQTTEGTSTISNNTLSGNSSNNGGGIFTLRSTNTISNNTLSGNSANQSGGGIYATSSTNTLSNNTLSGNSANEYGGGIYATSSTNTLRNNTLSGNSANQSGGGIYARSCTNTLSNNIFWGNKKGTDASVAGADYSVEFSSDNTFKNNLLQLASSNYTTIGRGVYDLGTGATGNLFAQDPLFVSTTDLRLQAESACINAGITGIDIPTTDITGAPRTGNPDMGAYEFSCPSGITLYVNASVSGGTRDGTSWANAYASLSIALAMAHCSNIKSIKVAAGTYKPTKKPFNDGVEMTTTDARDIAFHIPDGVTIEGGYNATIGSRDITANVTTLSGDINGNDVVSGTGATLSITGNTENAYHVVLVSAGSLSSGIVMIDGFSITGGNANGNSTIRVNSDVFYRYNGGGIYTLNGTNTLSNNTLSGNAASYSGAGIYTDQGTNTISNNTLSGNAAGEGGGIYTYQGTNTINNNTLSGNSASSGGGIYTNQGTNTINNNTLSGNAASNSGGGILTNQGTNTLSNNTLSGNAASSGGGIFTAEGTNTLSNNTFSGNAAKTYGGGIWTAGGTNTLNNNIFWGNKKGTDARVAGADYSVTGTNGNTFKNNLLQLASNKYTDVNVNGLGTGATGNLFAQDPLFVSTTDLRLQAKSPCINAGITGKGIPTTDIIGTSRPQGAGIDIGAYEYFVPKN